MEHVLSNQASRRSFLRMLPAASIMPAAAKGTTPASANQPWVITGPDRPELSVFDRIVIDYMQARRITAGALAITHDSRLVYARGFAFGVDGEAPRPVEPTSLFRIASVSKPITATAVIRLFQDLDLPLSERVQDILELEPPPGESPDPAMADVTVRHLLQHLSGWDRKIALNPMHSDTTIAEALGVPLPISKAHIATYMAGQPLQHVPGTTYAYTGFGYSLAGQVIEALTGMSYYHYVSRALFHPLGITRPVLSRTLEVHRLANEVKYYKRQELFSSVMDNCGTLVPSCYGAQNRENQASNGGWLASAVDLVRFASTFDRPDASPVLNPASIQRMFDPPENYTGGSRYYGCGWGVTRRRNWDIGSIAHSGEINGATSELKLDTPRGVNWCLLLNKRYADDRSVPEFSIFTGGGAINEAVKAVRTWPDDDLFAEYL